MIDFLRQQLAFIRAYCLPFVLFAGIFAVFGLDWAAYWLAVGLGALGLAFLLLGRFALYHRQRRLAERLADCQTALSDLAQSKRQQEKETADFLLAWIHQIKTPISSAKLLLDRADSPTADQVQAELTEIERYTELAMSYFRLQDPDTDLLAAPVRLDDLIAPVLRKYWLAFVQEGTRLHYTPIQQAVVTDAKLTRLMIEQLVNNAVKYARGKEVWITFQPEDEALTVRDSGVGIAEADLPKIFDRGYSGFNGRLSDRSSGIGLSLVAGIAERLGQPVSVVSQPGQGASFSIHFPGKLTEL